MFGTWYTSDEFHDTMHRCKLADDHIVDHLCKCGATGDWNVPGRQPWRGHAEDLVVAASGAGKVVHRLGWNRKPRCGRFFDQAPAPEGSVLTCKGGCY